MKIWLAVGLLVAIMATTSSASPLAKRPADEDVYQVNQTDQEMELLDGQASITQAQCPVNINIPIPLYPIAIQVCNVTPTTCGLVRVSVGTTANVLVRVCRLSNGGNIFVGAVQLYYFI